MKKKSKKKKKNKRISLEALIEKRRPRVYPLNSRPLMPVVVAMPGEKQPDRLPWPKVIKGID